MAVLTHQGSHRASKYVHKWHCSLVGESETFETRPRHPLLRNGGGGVRVNFRGNGSAVGLKLGGKVSAAARKVAGGVGGGDITMTCEPAPHVDASEPVVGLNMHPQWRRQSSELLGW